MASGGSRRALVAVALAAVAAALGAACSSSAPPTCAGCGAGDGNNVNANLNVNDSNVNVNAPPGAVPAQTVRLHYHRDDGAYAGWVVYSWIGTARFPTKATKATWPTDNFPLDQSDADGWGRHVDLAMAAGATELDFLVIQPNAAQTDAAKDCASDQKAALGDLSAAGQELWVTSGDCTVYTSRPVPNPVHVHQAAAIWLTADTLVWPAAKATRAYKLYAAADGGLGGSADGITGATASYDLEVQVAGLPADLRTAFPQWATATALKVPAAADPKALVKGQLVVAAVEDGKIADAKAVQIAPLLDALYGAAARGAALGVTFEGAIPTFAVWAPTARSVKLDVYDTATAAAASAHHDLVLDRASGVWSYTGTADLKGKYYTFTVSVFMRHDGSAPVEAVVTNTVSDPYAVSGNANGVRSMALDLADPGLQPSGWPGTLIPTPEVPTDSVLYELHVRDFSMADDSVVDPASGPRVKGKYLAFAQAGSKGMTHLSALAAAGLTHVHLLPAFDFSTVDEAACQEAPVIPASIGAGTEAETAVRAVQGADCFNWGYDPFHYGAPEGSYASDPADGAVRVREFRQMVQALHAAGLRVVMDVVYNHTTAAGRNERSVLDQLVPDYYHRLDGNGDLLKGSCCADTAAEHVMMEKLMTDTLVRWADAYKVDGFRYDLMGFHPRDAVLRARTAIDARAAADGRGHTYLYGEGWSNGPSGLFVPATQAGMAGTGVGTFDDRLRDAVRGGSVFDNGSLTQKVPNAIVVNQGFISGQCWANNDGSACTAAQQAAALHAQDLISVGLAANLAAFPLNATTTGAQVDYNGAPGGYGKVPADHIAYVSAHDNETLWDISQYKHAAGTTPVERARAQVVGLSIAALSQGIPFIHAGDELLRSKSLDSDSFDAGDYFNRIHWDGSGNGWAIGAPPQNARNNATNLADMQAATANANTYVTPELIRAASAAFQDFLRVRRSTSMFHLTTAAAVNACVSFPDQAGPRVPGLVVMRIAGDAGCGDAAWRSVVVLFNARSSTTAYAIPAYVGKAVTLHPVQRDSVDGDPVVKGSTFATATGTFSVPARTTAVFVEP